jgi:hypothetical protein
VGAGFGYLGQVADQRLSARLAYHLYHHGALRLGHEAAYPLWLGSRYLFRTGVPAGLGVTEEHLENQAQDRCPSSTQPAPPTHSPTQPAYSMSPLDLWNFVWEQGLTGIEIGAGVLGIFLTVTGGYSIRDLLQTPRAERIFRDIAAPFGAFLGAAACC